MSLLQLQLQPPLVVTPPASASPSPSTAARAAPSASPTRAAGQPHATCWHPSLQPARRQEAAPRVGVGRQLHVHPGVGGGVVALQQDGVRLQRSRRGQREREGSTWGQGVWVWVWVCAEGGGGDPGRGHYHRRGWEEGGMRRRQVNNGSDSRHRVGECMERERTLAGGVQLQSGQKLSWAGRAAGGHQGQGGRTGQ